MQLGALLALAGRLVAPLARASLGATRPARHICRRVGLDVDPVCHSSGRFALSALDRSSFKGIFLWLADYPRVGEDVYQTPDQAEVDVKRLCKESKPAEPK
jgi:hypothetical protein